MWRTFRSFIVYGRLSSLSLIALVAAINVGCTTFVEVPRTQYIDVEIGTMYRITTADGEELTSDLVIEENEFLVMMPQRGGPPVRLPLSEVTSIERLDRHWRKTVLLAAAIAVPVATVVWVLVSGAD
ncbi:MAG: hypothetical protein IH969_02535 [Candidatus Krumholzibacteriota bacterium]|nr:hypothetical protein [Candidatus Krumholzibacteriota bacterium]